MASMIENCPPEILSAICKTIAEDDASNTVVNNDRQFKALKSFSQASRAFLPHCREHIFCSIIIHDSWNPNDHTARRFTQLLEGAPEIADYVRHLRYGMRFHDDLHYAPVVSALDRLTGLKSLVLNIQGYFTSWTEHIPPATQSSLLKLIHLPTLVSLELRSFDSLNINLLPPSPNLQQLHLNSISFQDMKKKKNDAEESDEEDSDEEDSEEGDSKEEDSKEEDSKEEDSKEEHPEEKHPEEHSEEQHLEEDSESLVDAPVDSIRPQVLRIAKTPHYDDQSFSMMFDQKMVDGKPVFDFSGLKSVSFLISEKIHIKLEKAILSFASELESLEIAAEDPAYMEKGVACIQGASCTLSALKSLSFKVYLVHSDEHGSPSDPLCGIPKALSDIAGKNSIEVIKIQVFIYTKKLTEQDKWGDLEQVLTAHEWPSLRQVQLDIVTYIREKTAIEELKKLPDTKFQTLSLQQNFKFDFSASGP